MSELIYLACPFNHMDPSTRERRSHAAGRFASKLMRDGMMIFCPLSHHVSILQYGLPVGWDYWEKFNTEFLKKCDKLYVLKLEGWKDSVGVQAEIRLARKLNLPIEYHEPI
jgi:hypothetical protein